MPSPQTTASVHDRTSLLHTRHLSPDDIYSFFREAQAFRATAKAHGNFIDPRQQQTSGQPHVQRVVCCLFFEASTRTRMSFQTAAYRLGHQVLAMDPGSGSSLTKGESQLDTLLNIVAMGPDVLVVRYGKSPELDEVLPTLPMPVLNAGSGVDAHPTQALLDAFTIFEGAGSDYEKGLRGQRVLIVGDISHSRVARSNFDVLSKLGAEIAVCAPSSYLPEQHDMPPGTRVFESLDEAIAWPTVYMGLRIQLERHSSSDETSVDYHDRFGLNSRRLKMLDKNVAIMHPGPINHGVEFSADVIHDSRSRVLEQVANGVLIRGVLLNRALNRSLNRSLGGV